MANDKRSGRAEKKHGAKHLALLAVMLALAITLSILESAVPIPIPVPGVRLGLSNIVVMFALLHMKFRDALALAILKSTFVLLTRGAVAGAISMTGGMFAIAAMSLVILPRKKSATYLLAGILGAVAHNIGQFCAASLILDTLLLPYLPVLLLAGVLTGIATSVLLKLTASAFARLRLK